MSRLTKRAEWDKDVVLMTEFDKFNDYCEFSNLHAHNAYKNVLHKLANYEDKEESDSSKIKLLEREVKILRYKLHWIFAVGCDYDGCDSSESLKELIDELLEITQMPNEEFFDNYMIIKPIEENI